MKKTTDQEQRNSQIAISKLDIQINKAVSKFI